jgi:hypothetical protein
MYYYYLVTGTRPDLAHTVSLLSQFSSCPMEARLTAVKHTLRYLNKTKDWTLFYPENEPLVLEGYADADYTACLDTRRSFSGYVFDSDHPLSPGDRGNKPLYRHPLPNLNTSLSLSCIPTNAMVPESLGRFKDRRPVRTSMRQHGCNIYSRERPRQRQNKAYRRSLPQSTAKEHSSCSTSREVRTSQISARKRYRSLPTRISPAPYAAQTEGKC